VASFRTEAALPAEGILGGTNARLPEDLAVLSAEEVPEGFHAQRDAKGKLYRYRILNRRIPSPLDRRQVHVVRTPLDAAAMGRAAALLTGRHDFSSFKNTGSVEGSAVRNLHRLDIVESGAYIAIEAEADGFLYRMVRNLVGTLILVGRGALRPEAVAGILAGRERRLAGPAAPPGGLCLVEVYY
jgi:tRNA pseudouridine38-40 synthase